jgi:hypothetical protein
VANGERLFLVASASAGFPFARSPEPLSAFFISV